MSRRWFPGSLRSRPLPAFGRGTCPEGALDFSPTERLAEWGSGPSGPRGRGPEDRHESTVVSWLASLAPPPGLRPYSPVPLPFHGGEVRFARAPSRPSAGGLVRRVLRISPPRSGQRSGGVARQGRGGAVRRTAMSRRLFRGSLRSRPLPAFGRSPPFHCRFTGEKSVLFAPPPGLRPYSPVSLPFHGGEVLLTRSLLDFSPTERLAEWGSGPSGPRGRGPEDRHESTVVSWLASLAPPPGLRPFSPVPLPFHGGEVRFVRAPSRPSALLRRFTAVPRGRSPVDPVSLGFLPHGAVSGVGEWPVRAEGARSGGPP